MTRVILMLLSALAVSALLTVPAMAQATAPIGPQAGPWSVQVAPTQDQIEYLKKAQELHSKIQGEQLALWGLQQQNADQKKVEAKTNELTRLRTQLHELNVANRPALGAGPGWGFGGGPWASGGGFGWRGQCVGLGPRGQSAALGQYGRGAGLGQYGRGAGFRHRAGRGGGQGWRGAWSGGWGVGGGRGTGAFCPYQTF